MSLATHPISKMFTLYQNSPEGLVSEWPEDILITDEALENLKETAETGCVLCGLDDLGDEE